MNRTKNRTYIMLVYELLMLDMEQDQGESQHIDQKAKDEKVLKKKTGATFQT